MGVGIGFSFHSPMDMGINMGVIFENKYGRGYSLTRSEPVPLSFLIKSCAGGGACLLTENHYTMGELSKGLHDLFNSVY